MIQDIFKNEFLSMDGPGLLDEDKVKEILSVAHERKIAVVDFEKGQVSLALTRVTKNVLKFLRGLLQSYVDSYLVVAQTISCLQEAGVTIEQRKLLSQLHLSIQELHNIGIIRYMNSCLIEVLETAFGRFAELGVCDAHVYDSLGEKIVYIKAKLVINDTKLEQILQILGALSSVPPKNDGEAAGSQHEQNLQVMEPEIQKAILAAQGPMARM